MYVQEVLQTLSSFWARHGCILWQPYHTEVGAGTSNPATFLRVLGPEPWSVAYPEPSTRPADGRYGENPNRLQHYYQFQVILKPSPADVQDLFLQSLEALGLDLTQHDFRFVEDNWQSPSLGAWGLGWEAWLDGMEILQFTYFQECGGVKLDVRACELTYGVERIAMYLQGVESVYDLKWAPSGITYGDIYHASEVEYCKYNFEYADTEKLFKLFDLYEDEGQRLLGENLILPAYDHCLRLSHLFNLLDSRSALSVAERGRFLLRCRAIAERCAKGFLAQRTDMGFPLLRLAGQPQSAQAQPVLAEMDTTPAPKEQDTFLLEIGVEELPHADARTGAAHAPVVFAKLLADCGLEHGAITTYVTPRRIALQVQNMPIRMADSIKEVRGPKKSAARSDGGEWTVPARKFAEANGISVEDIYFREEGKFEYCFVRFHQTGKRLAELLSDMVTKLLRGIPFGKTMGWEDSTAVFSRPVRWIVALHGASVVPVAWRLREANELGPERFVFSGRVTYGHRRLAPKPIILENASEYLARLREGLVLADRGERMAALRGKVQSQSEALGLRAEDDEDLMDEICDLVEWPEPIVGEIPHTALVLPEDIIITPMKVHQRYIPLRNPDGTLSHRFMAVANGDHSDEGRNVIRAGNERVLNARLRDATYFWETDTKTSLRDFAKRLSSVMFHQKLGSVADKITRLRELYTLLKSALPRVNDDEMNQTLDLMKADLCTQMVFEFDSLEGVVGMLYARKEGIPDNTAQAILEHRLPRRAGDKMPTGKLGVVAGLLDRMDTLAGYFGIGLRAKGTSDPFGLRRNALALMAILRDHNVDLDLEPFAWTAVEAYGAIIEDHAKTVTDLLSFFADRLAVVAKDEGAPYDRVAAAAVRHGRQPMRFFQCLKILTEMPEDDAQNLAEQAKRMARIVQEPAAHVDPALLEENEKELWQLCGAPAQRIRDLVERKKFVSAFADVLAWTPIIANYFEVTLVNHENAAIRQNRHALLRDILSAMRCVADFTQIEKK